MPTPLARRLDLALLAAALALAVVLGTWNLSEPWENGFKGTNGGAYMMRFLQSHLDLGLSVTRGALVHGLDPCEPRAPVIYANHPATLTLLFLPAAALFGPGEATVRVMALLLYLPAVAALWWLARRLLGAPAAGACALLFATTAMSAYYGPMAAPDGPLLACRVLVAGLFLEQAGQPTRARGTLLSAVFLLACLLDWSAAFMVPMLLVLVPLAPDRRRALATLAWLLALGAVAALLLFTHTALVLGGLQRALAQWQELVGFTQRTAPGFGELLASEAHDARTWFGPVLLVLAALGVVTGLLAPRASWLRRALRVATALTLPGLLNVLVFRSHALHHDFWSLSATPGLVLAASLPLAAALRAADSTTAPAGRRAAGAAVVLLVLAGLHAGWSGSLAATAATHRHATTFHRDIGRRLDRWFGPDDVVVTSVPLVLADLYAQATILGPVREPQTARELVALYAPPAFKGHLAFLLPSRDRHSPLAQALDQMTVPEALPRAVVYRIRR